MFNKKTQSLVSIVNFIVLTIGILLQYPCIDSAYEIKSLELSNINGISNNNFALDKNTSLKLQSSITVESRQVKATWIPWNFGGNSESELERTITDLHKQGINRVYICVWNQGKLFFQSKTMLDLNLNSMIGPNRLQWAINAAKKLNDMEVFAWFEYGTMVSYGGLNNDFANYANSNGWLLGEAKNWYWMDPSNKEVLDFLSGILIDAQQSDPYLKGVQLDDHFGWPREFRGGSEAKMNFAAEFISNKFHGLFKNDNKILSLSPNVLRTAKFDYNNDWAQWAKKGYFTEFVPQLYRSDFSSFKREFDYTESNLATLSKFVFLAGIRAQGSGSPTPWQDVAKMMDYTNQHQYGVSIWFANSIQNLYKDEFYNYWH